MTYYEPIPMLSTSLGFSFNQLANLMKENHCMKWIALRNRPGYHLLDTYYMPGPVLFDIHYLPYYLHQPHYVSAVIITMRT